jgi:hypothetical protein
VTQARIDLDARPAERAAAAQARASHRGPITDRTALGLFTTTVYAKVGAGEYPVGELTIDLDAPEGTGPIVRYNDAGADVGAEHATLEADAARAAAAQRRAATGAPNTTPGNTIDGPTAAERAADALAQAATYAAGSLTPAERADMLVRVAGGYRELAVAVATVDGLTRPTEPEGARR